MNAQIKTPYDYAIEPLLPFLERTDVTDICINTEGEVFLDTTGEIAWEHHVVPELTKNKLMDILTNIAGYNNQSINNLSPMLAATLPTGERIQGVIHPACHKDQIILAIRKQTIYNVTLEDLERLKFFSHRKTNQAAKNQKLLDLYHAQEWRTFIEQAVKDRMNIIFSGATGSGKTTTLNAVLKEIDPNDRVVTIEDNEDVVLDVKNKVSLFYSDKNESPVTADDLLKASLRLRPDRIMLGELRGVEAFTFTNALLTGHNGSMTTLHANSPKGVFDRLAFMLLQSRQGFTPETATIFSKNVIDIIVQVGRDGGVRHTEEIWYKDAEH